MTNYSMKHHARELQKLVHTLAPVMKRLANEFERLQEALNAWAKPSRKTKTTYPSPELPPPQRLHSRAPITFRNHHAHRHRRQRKSEPH